MQSERRQIETRVERLCELVPKVEEDETRAELTKHLCVLISGLIEVSCRDILNKYSKVRCTEAVLRHVSKNISSFQNPSSEKIVALFSSFDPKLTEKWESEMGVEGLEGINSIVSNRHQIAHGRSIGLSFDVLYRYYKSALDALKKLEESFPGHKEQ